MTDGLGLWDVYAANMERKMAYAGGKSRFGIGALTRISQAAVEGGLASPSPCNRVRLRICKCWKHPFDNDISGLLPRAYQSG